MASNMKTFTPQSIASRIKANFLKRENIRTTVDDQAVDSLISAVAEEFAEGVRYDEYLTRENVWDYVRNLSSGVGMAAMLGYRPRRKRSAVATLTFTVDGNIRRFGAFDNNVWNEYLNEDGTLDVLLEEPGVISLSNLRSLRHYPGVGQNPSLEIPRHTVIQDRMGDTQYITLESRTIEFAGSLEADQDPQQNSTSRWARIPAIQGVKRSFISRDLRGREFERVSINSRNVEDMRAEYSKDFLKVSVRLPGAPAGQFEEWQLVDDVRSSGPYDRVYMIETALDYSNVAVVFGNGISGFKLPAGSDVEVEYLETTGEDGNIDEMHRITEIRTPILNYPNVPLYVTNLNPVVSGRMEDTLADIKRDAPRHYLTVESVGSEAAYVAAIESLPDVRKARVFRGVYRNNLAATPRDTVSFSAIAEDGSAPDSTDIVPRVQQLLGRKVSPTDILQYEPAERILIAYNIRGYIDDITRPLQFFVNEARRIVFNNFRIRELDFKESIFHIDVLTALRTGIDALEAASAFPEALIINEFYRDVFFLGDEGALRMDFSYDPSLAPFRNIVNNVEHVLRVDFIVNNETIRHRSRSVLLIPNPDLEENPNADPFIVRQFGLLGDAVLTPERTRAVLADTSGVYAEKNLTIWHWINRTELTVGDPAVDDPEDFDVWFDTNDDLQLQPQLVSKLDPQVIPTRNWRIESDTPSDPVFFYYSDAVDIESMDPDVLLEYYEEYRDWQSAEWAQDPDAANSIINDSLFGDIPTVYVPDSTHAAPIELNFLTRATEAGAEQAGSGSIFIRPAAEGKVVEFIPSTQYRTAQADELNTVRILARPLRLDLMLQDDFSIFNLLQEEIKIDFRYRTDEDNEFQVAVEQQLIEDEG